MKRLLLLLSVAAVLLSGCAGLGKDEWTPVNLPKSLEKQWVAFDYFQNCPVYMMDFAEVKGKACFASMTHEQYDSGKYSIRFNSDKLYTYTCEKRGKEYRLVFNSETSYYFSDITEKTATFRVNDEENPTTEIQVADPPIKIVKTD